MDASLDPAQFSDLVVDGLPPKKCDGDHRTVATTNMTSALVDEVVHDLRQPAACIRALVASCRVQPAGNGALAWHLDKIEEQAIVVLATVASLLEGDSTEDQVTDLAECVADAVASLRLTNMCDVDIRAPERLLVAGSPTDLRRALVNVLDNACRAAGPTGRVVLTMEQSATVTRVVVEDDGPGFGSVDPQHLIGLSAAARGVRKVGGSVKIGRSATLGGAHVTLALNPRMGGRSGAGIPDGHRHAATPV